MLLRDGVTIRIPILTVCEPLIHQPIKVARETFDHIKGLELADSSEESDCLRLDMLLGCDHYWKFVTGEVRLGTCGPTAINTTLVWVLSGPLSGSLPTDSIVNFSSVHTLHIHSSPSLDMQLSRFWDLESLGIQNQESSVQTQFENSVSFDGIRYKVCLPWKEDHPSLSTNLSLREKRLTSQLHR